MNENELAEIIMTAFGSAQLHSTDGEERKIFFLVICCARVKKRFLFKNLEK